jgi:hypothetical protein
MSFTKIIASLLLVAGLGGSALAAKSATQTVSSLRRYENRLGDSIAKVRGVNGIGIGATRAGKPRLDVMLVRRSATAKRAVLDLIKDKAPRLSTRFVRFVVVGTIRAE